MRLQIVGWVLVLSIASAVVPPQAGEAEPLATGLWSGGIGSTEPADGSWRHLFVQVDESDASGFRGHAAIGDASSLQGKLVGDQVRFTVKFGGDKVRFVGTLAGDRLTGHCTRKGQPAPCLLIHEGNLDEDLLADAAGFYSFDDDHRVVLSRSFHLIYSDLKTGDVRALYAAGDGRFTAGPAISIPRPIESELRLERGADGAVTGFAFEDAGGAIRNARRLPSPRTEEFEFSAPDGIVLRGTLYLPPGPGPHPGVVWVHGSGKQDRRGAGIWPWFFTDLGFAMLAVDKRGVGASDGRYALPGGGRDNRPHMVRRSKDVRAAARALAAHDDVRNGKVGLAGASQAGWVIPMAASGNDAIAFSVVLSGGATNLSYESVFSKWADEDGSGIGSAPIDDVLQRTREHKPRDKDFREFFTGMVGPALWLYGGKDRSNPSQLCVELIEEIAAAESKDFSVEFFADGNHSLMEARHGGAAENSTLRRRVPGLYAKVRGWLDAKDLLP